MPPPVRMKRIEELTSTVITAPLSVKIASKGQLYIPEKDDLAGSVKFISPSDSAGSNSGKDWVLWLLAGIALLAALWYIIFKMK
jgi:hypothetical protein